MKTLKEFLSKSNLNEKLIQIKNGESSKSILKQIKLLTTKWGEIEIMTSDGKSYTLSTDDLEDGIDGDSIFPLDRDGGAVEVKLRDVASITY